MGFNGTAQCHTDLPLRLAFAVSVLLASAFVSCVEAGGWTSSGVEEVKEPITDTRYHSVGLQTFQWGNNNVDVEKCRDSVTDEQQLEQWSDEESSQTNAKRSNGGVKMGLSHIHSACSPLRPSVDSSWIDMVSQSMDRDSSRLNFIHSKIAKHYNKVETEGVDVDVPVESGAQFGSGNYIMTAGFGTPAKKYSLAIDTGSDITWIQCKPCRKGACYKQQNPIFDPQNSSSYKPLGCHSRRCRRLRAAHQDRRACDKHERKCVYEITYGDGSTTSGDIGLETLILGSHRFHNFTFGCGHKTKGLFNGTAGLIGLGRSPVSLVSQTAHKYKGQFSYCLPDFNSPESSGSFSMGHGSIPSSAVFTPMLSDRSFYSVGLDGISVGGKRLSLPSSAFQRNSKGEGGTIIDSGTVITRLEQAAYDVLKDSFVRMTPHLTRAKRFSILDTCFNLSGVASVKVPTVTFHFKGGADVDVDAVGTLLPFDNDGSYVCLAFAPTSSGGLNIIGNVQQQRLRVAYDTLRKRIGFAPESCST